MSDPIDGPQDVPPPDLPPQAGSSRDVPPRGAPRAFRRDTANGMVGGVAAGLARYLGVDVVWVRLAFVLATVIGWGFGVVAYLAAWLIVPAGDAATRLPRTSGNGRGPAFWTGVVLVAAGAAILLDTLLRPLARVVWFDPFDALFPLLLIGVGAAIWRSSRDRDGAAPDRGDADAGAAEGAGPGRFERWTEEVEERAEAFGGAVERRAESWEAQRQARATALREARSRARVAPITLGAALLVLGGIWLLSSLEVPGMTVPRALSAALLVIGVGLIVGAFLGRGRGLVPAGLLLAPVVVVATLAGQVPGGLETFSVGKDGMIVGDTERRIIRPDGLAALDRAYEFDAGSIVLDLRGLDADELAAAGEVRLEIELGAGELRVILPDDVAADVRVELGVGEVRIDGEMRGGLGLEVRRTLGDREAGRGLIDLRIEQGVGTVKVTR